jgi:hypothetical protein
MVDPEIRLYVNGVKTLTGTIEVERLYVPRTRLPTTVKTDPMREYVLPDNQRKTVEMVERISRNYGLAAKVVDVAKENVLRRIMQKEKEKVDEVEKKKKEKLKKQEKESEVQVEREDLRQEKTKYEGKEQPQACVNPRDGGIDGLKIAGKRTAGAASRRRN